MYKEIVAINQPVIYRILENALLQDRLAHAYLFVGEQGTGKKETAYLLAKSIICEQEGFACEQCASCKRIEKDEYTDFIYVDGRSESIKKHNIAKIQEEFSKTALEQSGKKVYILDHVENATLEAINALLKFLEEPSSSIVAILIAENVERVLPTIISRCQTLHFKSLTQKERMRQVEGQMDELDAYLLSQIICDKQAMIAASEEDRFQHARYVFTHFVEELLQNPYDALLFLQLEALNGKNKSDHKQIMGYFFDFISIFCKDVIKKQCSITNTWYNTYVQKLQERNYNVIAMEHVIIQTRDKLLRNSNLSLLIDQFVYQLKEVMSSEGK